MNNGPKILHIIDSLGLGGAQTVVKGILEYQPENKSIFLFALRKRDITMEIKHSNVRIFNSTWKYSLRPLFELRNLISKEKIDILHCHLFRSQVFGWLLKVIWFRNIKLIFHEHGGVVEDGCLYTTFVCCSKKSVRLYIAISSAMKNALMANAKITESKIVIVHNFVDLKKFDPNIKTAKVFEVRSRMGFDSKSFVVGFAARIVERKGWKEFVDGAIVALKIESNIRFLIAGDGCQKNELQRRILESGFQNQIIYDGFVSDMYSFYKSLNCFVIPSYYEPMGLTEIEAWAMNVVVIASDVPGLNEIVKNDENGLLIEPRNANALANAVLKLYRDAELRKVLISKAKNDVQRYSLPTYMLHLDKIYNAL